MSRSLRIFTSLSLFLLLAGCSQSPSPEANKERPRLPEPVSAQSAFYKMFPSARNFAADAQVLRVAQIDVDELQGGGGKAAAWEAVFVSPSQGRMQRYIFSVIHRPARNLRGGVTADPPESWSRASGAEPFLFQAFKTDSPAAWAVAMKHGGDYAGKNPGQPVRFLLERTRRFPDPVWRVFWGESLSTSAYSIFVDATTGEYLATGR